MLGVTAFGIFRLSIRSSNEEVEANRVANGVNKMKKVVSVGDSPAKVREEARNAAVP